MKIIRTANYKKAQESTIDLVGGYIFEKTLGGNYLAWVFRADDPNINNKDYWPTFHRQDGSIAESVIKPISNVPIDIAKRLLTQGKSNQLHPDGRSAAAEAAPYVSE